MTDCLFCRIVEGSIPAEIVYQDTLIMAFKDIQPRAQVHLLVIPKQHITSLQHTSDAHQMLMGHIMLQLPTLAKSQGLNDGFRTIINTGPAGGQEIAHLHIHLLGGKDLPGFH